MRQDVELSERCDVQVLHDVRITTSDPQVTLAADISIPAAPRFSEVEPPQAEYADGRRPYAEGAYV